MYSDNKDVRSQNIFKLRRISLLCLYIGIIILAMGVISVVFLILGIGLFVSFLVIGLIFWRCPYCERGFELRHSSMDNMTHCPFCGERLRND